MKKMGKISQLAFILVIVGAINWGLVGLMDFNLVAALFGVGTTLSRVVYLLVGLSGVLMIGQAVRCAKSCSDTKGSASTGI